MAEHRRVGIDRRELEVVVVRRDLGERGDVAGPVTRRRYVTQVTFVQFVLVVVLAFGIGASG